MLSNVFKDKKNERLGLLLATGIFALMAVVQLCRAASGMPVVLGSVAVPIWLSVVVGILMLMMSYWMGVILNRHRPLL
jgi:hypothetical protein